MNTKTKVQPGWVVAALIFCIVLAIGQRGTAQEETTKNYVIGAEDVLEITVWGHDDLHRVVTVAADGSFSFPLIGRIQTGGLTVRKLEETIAKKLDQDYIVDPQVTIAITDFRSKKVFVLGEVSKPGAYYLSKTDTLLEILSKAGGISQNAGREIIVVRPKVAGAVISQPLSLDSQNSQQIRIDVRALMAGDTKNNIQVLNNDTIYVPRSSVFSVFGEVKKPGSYPLEKEMTVLEALSIAGGPTQDADPQKLELLRKDGDSQKKIVLNMRQLLETKSAENKDSMIQDGDVIYQPRAEFFFVMGEVNKPGTYKLEEGMTVTKAISVAGGFTEKASKKKIEIVREENGKQVKHRAQPNELVKPQDIIEVPQSLF